MAKHDERHKEEQKAKHKAEHTAEKKMVSETAHEVHHETLHEMKERPNVKLWIMAVTLALLIVVSGIQAVELAGLNDKVNKELSGVSASKPVISTSSGSSSQKNLDNLPSMVGGC